MRFPLLQATGLAGCAAALQWLAWAPPALAESFPEPAATQAPAADARVASPPPAHQPLHPQPLPQAQPTAADWRAAHAAVGEFPRGHADILAWEARQGAAAERAAPKGAHGATPGSAHRAMPGGHGSRALPSPEAHHHHAPAGGAR